jgi:hypothetical protein
MRYRFLKGRLKRAMGTRMSVTRLAANSGVSTHVIRRILAETNQYVMAEQEQVRRLALALGVTYEYLAYGRVHDHPMTGMDVTSLTLERSRLLGRVAELERRRPVARPPEPVSPVMRWVDEAKIELKWTPEGKCQILHDHEYVLAEGETSIDALMVAHAIQRDTEE